MAMLRERGGSRKREEECNRKRWREVYRERVRKSKGGIRGKGRFG